MDFLGYIYLANLLLFGAIIIKNYLTPGEGTIWAVDNIIPYFRAYAVAFILLLLIMVGGDIVRNQASLDSFIAGPDKIVVSIVFLGLIYYLFRIFNECRLGNLAITFAYFAILGETILLGIFNPSLAPSMMLWLFYGFFVYVIALFFLRHILDMLFPKLAADHTAALSEKYDVTMRKSKGRRSRFFGDDLLLDVNVRGMTFSFVESPTSIFVAGVAFVFWLIFGYLTNFKI